MNLRLVSKLLGTVALLIGAMMLFSLPWSFAGLAHRHAPDSRGGDWFSAETFEARAFAALVSSIIICGLVGVMLWWCGRQAKGKLFRKEAMAVVGLSWILATVLGAMPFYFSGTYRCSSVRLMGQNEIPYVYKFQQFNWRQWAGEAKLSGDEYAVVETLNDAGARGLSEERLIADSKVANAPDLLEALAKKGYWKKVLFFPGGKGSAPSDRADNYRIRWVRMGLVDSLFESQSGFSTTGATVISDLEDPVLVPHGILFWRSSTHFLGGLGIIVLFVVILGQGSAGKALMRAEMPGPTKEGSTARMQHTAWLFAMMYCGLNIVLAIILKLQGLTVFDSLCHSFGTMATGGFSPYNASLGHYQSVAAINDAVVEYTVLLFMILAGTNFTLLYLLLLRQPGKLLADVEWRVYMAVIFGVSFLVVLFGLAHGDFKAAANAPFSGQEVFDSVRFGLFQVVSIVTTTGYGTHNFDAWNSFGRGVLFLLMFVGGCAGSTGGGMKVIRHILFLKIMRLEIEQAYHPTVVRPLRLGGNPVEFADLRKNIMVYFGLILVIFVFSWMFVVTVEPSATWGSDIDHKLIDSATGVASTLNNIGPGLGTVGATENYSHFSPASKILFTWLMMIGRLEIFAILVLFVPSFWRNR